MQSHKHQLPAGMIVGGRYSVVRPLGQGGMAHVYLADDQLTQSQIALKVMNDDISHDPEFIKRFDTEARAASRLDHPNIVKVLGYGQDEDLRYIVQEYVEGCTLSEMVHEKGALSWQEALPLMIQIALALEHAHRGGVIHRDIKPHNILITSDGIAKVTDFGIARAVDSNTITLTSGVTFGSVHYFSPEQARGGLISEKSDLYSFGIMLHEVLTARLPFDGDTSVAVAIKHLQEMPPPASSLNPDIPRSLDNIITKCIQKSPENRYQNARELVDELDAFMADPNGVYGVLGSQLDRDTSTSAISLQRPESNFAKLREIEKTIVTRRRSRQRDIAIVVGIILLSLFFLFVIGSWAWEKISGGLQTPTDTTFEIGTYIGMDITDVEKELAGTGVDYSIIYRQDDSVDEDIVIDQNPSPGMTIRPGGSILYLYVSGGRNMITVPDYSGETLARAKAELSLNFDVSIKYEYSDYEKDRVIKTIPAAGQRVATGSEIVLVVSDGLPNVSMPNLVGKSFSEAKAELIRLNLVLGPLTSLTVDPETGAPVDVPEAQRVVIEQSIAPGTEINAQRVIGLTYGTQLDYVQFFNPTPTPNPIIIMPDLAGMKYSEAINLLTELNLTLGPVVSMATDPSTGEIIDLEENQRFILEQSIVPGTEVLPPMMVSLTYGTQRDYQQFINPTPTPEPTPTPTTTTAPPTTTTTKATTTTTTTTEAPEDNPGQGQGGG